MLKFTFCSKQISSPACSIGFRNFHNSSSVFGIGEFIEVKKSTAPMTAGRAWTSPDLRRKVLFFIMLCSIVLCYFPIIEF